jgi:flagellar hook-basal body complex protein FliE
MLALGSYVAVGPPVIEAVMVAVQRARIALLAAERLENTVIAARREVC